MSVPNWCNLDKCPLKWGYLHYRPSIAGNAIMLASFGILIPPTIQFGLKYRAKLFSGAMVTGLFAEMAGYIGRILLYSNPFSKNYFLIYLICTTLGPTFMAAAIYLCLARIVVVYGEELSRMRPRTYTLLFCGCNIVSLGVQAAGGGIAAVSWTKAEIDKGTHILAAGLSLQVASLLLFMGICGEFAFRLRRHKERWNARYWELVHSSQFRSFLYCLSFATVLIFIRSVFRTAELSGGFSGRLAQNQVSFMLLDGAMVLFACLMLTLMHPGIGFGGAWAETASHFRTRRKLDTETPESIPMS